MLRHVEEGIRFLFGVSAVEFVQAQVIVPAFEDCDLRFRFGLRRECLHKFWKVSFYDLRLEGQGCGRHDNGFCTCTRMVQGWHQIPEGFTGSGACLHEEMPLKVESLRNMGCHPTLSEAFLPARFFNRTIEQI